LEAYIKTNFTETYKAN